MEKNINLAKILNGKPVNTKLWSPLFGDAYTSSICSEDTIIVVNHHAESSSFYNNGKYFDHAEAEPLLFPSKEMRDWEKFSWKKGDVLVSNDGKERVIFVKFQDNRYMRFFGKFFSQRKEDGDIDYKSNLDASVNDYTLENMDAAQTYIKAVEERCGGKFNLETLKIEKAQPEFKDGDIVFMKGIKSKLFANCIFILKGEYKDGDERAFYYAFYNADDKFTEAEYGNTKVHYSLRSATDSEKQQLFDALAKKGKAWDAKKKMIVDLKPKVELKPFDKVLCRNSKDDTWEADFFARLTRKEIDYTQSGKYLCVGDLWMYCIPYNEETAHLLGTTDEWKGGEG